LTRTMIDLTAEVTATEPNLLPAGSHA